MKTQAPILFRFFVFEIRELEWSDSHFNIFKPLIGVFCHILAKLALKAYFEPPTALKWIKPFVNKKASDCLMFQISLLLINTWSDLLKNSFNTDVLVFFKSTYYFNSSKYRLFGQWLLSMFVSIQRYWSVTTLSWLSSAKITMWGWSWSDLRFLWQLVCEH